MWIAFSSNREGNFYNGVGFFIFTCYAYCSTVGEGFGLDWHPSRIEDLSLMLARSRAEEIQTRVWTKSSGVSVFPTDLHLDFSRNSTYLVIDHRRYLIQRVQKGLRWNTKPYEISFLLDTDRGPCYVFFQSNLKKHLRPEAKRLHLLS